MRGGNREEIQKTESLMIEMTGDFSAIVDPYRDDESEFN